MFFGYQLPNYSTIEFSLLMILGQVVSASFSHWLFLIKPEKLNEEIGCVDRKFISNCTEIIQLLALKSCLFDEKQFLYCCLISVLFPSGFIYSLVLLIILQSVCFKCPERGPAVI